MMQPVQPHISTLLLTCWRRLQRQSRRAAAATAAVGAPPRRVSALVRRNLAYAACRWTFVAAGALATSAVLLTADEMAHDGSMLCSASSAGHLSLLHVWVAVATLRILAGAALRVVLWWMWDARVRPEQQRRTVGALIRGEFVLSLLSVMWTTIGFLSVLSSSSGVAAAGGGTAGGGGSNATSTGGDNSGASTDVAVDPCTPNCEWVGWGCTGSKGQLGSVCSFTTCGRPCRTAATAAHAHVCPCRLLRRDE